MVVRRRGATAALPLVVGGLLSGPERDEHLGADQADDERDRHGGAHSGASHHGRGGEDDSGRANDSVADSPQPAEMAGVTAGGPGFTATTDTVGKAAYEAVPKVP